MNQLREMFIFNDAEHELRHQKTNLKRAQISVELKIEIKLVGV